MIAFKRGNKFVFMRPHAYRLCLTEWRWFASVCAHIANVVGFLFHQGSFEVTKTLAHRFSCHKEIFNMFKIL